MTASVLGWLRARGACDAAIAWVEAQACQSPDALVAACPWGEWLLWLASRLGYDTAALARAARPAWLRAAREYTPAALDDASMPALAATFRALPSEATPYAYGAVQQMLRDPIVRLAVASVAMAARAAQSGQVSTAAREAAFAADLDGAQEHARCADDVRRALPDLAQRWARALA